MRFLLLLLVPSIGFCVQDCDVTQTIQQIRPGASWTIKGQDLTTLRWLDASVKPTAQEIATGQTACLSASATRKAAKDAAKAKAKAGTAKLDDVILLLDLDL